DNLLAPRLHPMLHICRDGLARALRHQPRRLDGAVVGSKRPLTDAGVTVACPARSQATEGAFCFDERHSIVGDCPALGQGLPLQDADAAVVLRADRARSRRSSIPVEGWHGNGPRDALISILDLHALVPVLSSTLTLSSSRRGYRGRLT